MGSIIKVTGLSKQYRIGGVNNSYSTLRDALATAARAPLQRLRRYRNHEANTIWALKDVSFEIWPGEVIGIIGRNGAGKSTLLKILSRITEPTSGRLELYGRSASLLEVGTGFHPELTGRENTYLNGAILGMPKSEIKRKFDEIVAFAEIEKFIDTPVKFYSSGMYVRLAFAVAAHLEPEILVLDEVLAVGDTAFQQKCLGKMRDVSSHGRTVLLVSHSMATVGQLCKKTLWLDEGRVKEFGLSDSVIQSYLNSQKPVGPNLSRDETEIEQVPAVFILGARIRNSENKTVSILDAKRPFSDRTRLPSHKPYAGLGWIYASVTGRRSKSWQRRMETLICMPRSHASRASTRLYAIFPKDSLTRGNMHFPVYAARTVAAKVDILDYLENVIAFGVENPSGVGSYMPKKRVGVISPKLDWEMKSCTSCKS